MIAVIDTKTVELKEKIDIKIRPLIFLQERMVTYM